MSFDTNGYPTEQTLKTIRECQTFWKSPEQLSAFIEYIRTHWRYAGCGYFSYRQSTGHLELHTGGWSGNEDILVALKESLFWSFYWSQSIRGGHHWFQLPAHPAQKTTYGPLDYNDGGRWFRLGVQEYADSRCIEIEEVALDRGELNNFLTVPNCRILPLASELLRVADGISPCESCRYVVEGNENV